MASYVDVINVAVPVCLSAGEREVHLSGIDRQVEWLDTPGGRSGKA
jgi:hypothetical protein